MKDERKGENIKIFCSTFFVARWKQSQDLFVMLQLCLRFPIASVRLNEESVSEDELAKVTFLVYLLVV